MKRGKKDQFLILIFILHLAFFLVSCGSDSPTSSDDTPPEIPPTGTMTIDLSTFFAGGNAAAPADQLHGSNQNFITALAVVTFVNAFVVLGLSVPVAVTAAALSVEPTLEADGKFHWVYTQTVQGSTITAELTADVGPSVVHWEMHITGQIGATSYDNFLWYEGDGNGQGTSGFWQFYDASQPNSQVEFVRVDYDYTSDTDKTLTFENNRQGDPGFGSTIDYAANENTVTMTVFRADQDKTIEISWDRMTGEGYILAPDYNNGEQACWDENQQDVACPE